MATDYTKAYVHTLPYCDIHMIVHKIPDVIAEYDAKTSDGRWASMCLDCFVAEDSTLGLGKGQRYVLGEPPVTSRAERQAEVNAAIAANDFDAFFDACGDEDPMEFL